MDNGMSQEEAEKLAATPPAPRPTPATPAARPAGPALDLPNLNVPIIIINGEFDRPRAKSTRAAREAKDVEIVELPGKPHLPAIAGGGMPKENLHTLSRFTNSLNP